MKINLLQQEKIAYAIDSTLMGIGNTCMQLSPTSMANDVYLHQLHCTPAYALLLVGEFTKTSNFVLQWDLKRYKSLRNYRVHKVMIACSQKVLLLRCMAK